MIVLWACPDLVREKLENERVVLWFLHILDEEDNPD